MLFFIEYPDIVPHIANQNQQNFVALSVERI
jgi:hypothetical protein